jgi:hypothetical protein
VIGRRLCYAVLRLYPEAWRARYGLEVRALIEQSEVSPSKILDLVRGALDAHLHPTVQPAPVRQLRGSVVATIYCGFAFVLVGAGFAKATEDVPFRGAEASHGLLGGARTAVIVLALACGAVVAVVGTPIALSVVRQAWRGDAAVRRALLLPAAAAGPYVAATAGLVVLANHLHGNGGLPGHLAFLGWIALTVLAAGVGARGVRNALVAASLERSQLVLGVTGAWLLARLMAVLTLAVLLYAVALAALAPRVAALSNGPLAFGTTAVLVAQAAVMALISALALLTAWRGRLAAAR